MTKMDLGRSQSQGDACATACQQLATQLGELTGATALFNDSDFKGEAASKVKNFVTTVFVPFIKAAVMLTSAIGKDVKQLPAKYVSSVANRSWSTEALERKIREIQARIRATDNLIDTLSHHHDSDHSHAISSMKQNAETNKNAYQSQLKKYQEILHKFNTFNAASPQIFTNLANLKAAFQQGAQQVQSCRQSNFAIPAEIGWTKIVNNEWQSFCKKGLCNSFKQSLTNSLKKSEKQGAAVLTREFGFGVETYNIIFLNNDMIIIMVKVLFWLEILRMKMHL